jgi:hypothetical protein
MSQSWSTNNDPSGQRLVQGLAQLFGSRPSGTAPSVAQMGELERIARLYGRLPPIDPALLEGLPQQQPQVPIMPQMPEGRVAPSARPVAPGFLAGLAPPPPPEAMLPALPTSEPVTPPMRPQDRAAATPQTPGEANFLQRLLAGTPTEELPYPTDRLLPGLQAARERRAGRVEPRPRDDVQIGGRDMPLLPVPEEELPVPPIPPEQVVESEATAQNALAAAGVTPRDYGRFTGRDPDFASVREQYERGRPQGRERDPEERMLRIIASTLGGIPGRYGTDVAAGSVAGLGAGYARESDRDEAIWQREDDARRQFELGLAGLLGQQEQAQFNNQLQRQTFDRQSAIAGDADARAREGLGIQRENAGYSRLLTQLRIAGLAEVVRNNAPITLRDAEGRASEMTLAVPGEYIRGSRAGQPQRLGFAQARRAISETLGRDPAYIGQGAALDRAVNGVLSQLLRDNILALPEEQRRQVLPQILPWMEGRPRAGTTRVDDE